MIPQFVNSLIEGKRNLWNFKFNQKVVGRPANLGGIGKKALTLKLDSSAKYPNLEIKGFLSWNSYNDWTEEEKALAKALIDELGL